MQTVPLTAHLTQLTRLRLVNAFLVSEDDGLTLVDTTIGGSTDAILAAARQAGGSIRRIAITHGHGDHVGSLDALRGALGRQVEISMGTIDARIHAGETVVVGKLAGSWPKLQATPDRRLEPGDRVGSLEVVASPGHTPGHIAFLDTRDRALIAGDVFHTVGGVAVSSHLFSAFPLPATATYDNARDLQSARELRALDPSLLVVGHGSAVHAPAARMDAAIARAERH